MKFLYRLLLLLVFFLFVWFTPLLDIEYEKSIVEANTKVIDEIALKYAKRDINSYFPKLIFLQMYDDIIYVFNKERLKIDSKKPIIVQFDSKKYIKVVKRIDKLKETIKNFNNSKYLSEIYVYPINNKGYMYKIDTQTFNIYFISSKIVKKLNNNPKFLRFDFNLRSLYFIKSELLTIYKSDLLKVFNLSNKVNNEIYQAIGKYLENKIYFAKWVLTILLLLGYIVVEILISRYKNSKIEILNKIEKFKREEQEYKAIKHYSQHDIKTNSQIILDKLFAIFLKIRNNDEAVKMLAELNLLEYTILQANSYSKNDYTATNQYRFHKDIYDENFIKFFQDKPFKKELLQIAKDNIFRVKIELGNLEEKTINTIKNELYQNELSLVFFKLLNNSIKHRKKDSIIEVYIGKDSQNRFMMKILDEIIDDEECKEVKAKIEYGLKSDNSHNMSIIKHILKKYELELKFNCRERLIEAVIQTMKQE